VWHEGELVGVAVASAADEARYLPMETVLAIGDQLLDTEAPKAVHDAKPLMRALMDRGLALRGLAFDTALAAYVINPAERTPDLADLASSVLGLEVDSPDADVGSGDDQGTLKFEAEGPDIGAAGRQAVAVAKLVPELTERMEARGGRELYDEVELPLVGVLARMERAGIGVDREYLGELGDSLRDRLATIEKDVYAEAGEPFNINSALQLREVLFERLGLPILKKTPKGAPSTDAVVLTKLAEEHPVVEHLLRYRELEKLRSTYVDGLLPLVSADGRIHAHFNQMGAATGRLSSDHPNLQNIPVRSPEGMTIRRAFVADPGHHFVVADYSQIELRILAHLSEDTGLIDAFAADEDIHTATAARVFGIDPTEVTPEQRRRAKVINFGLLYGMESYGLAQRLEISTEEAQDQMDAYFAQYPDVQAFMKGIVAEARESGYTTTILGRRRYLPELASGNFRQRQTGERMALNAPIQGSAADVIKKAMVQLDADLQMSANGTRMLLQIHDELVLEVPDDQMEEAQEHIRTVMEGVVPLRVPLRVDVATGRDLAECKA
jgi:DNA polymerase-1